MTYASTRRINLRGSQFLSYDGSHLDVYGGITLAFDSEKHLRSMCVRLVADEDVRQIEILTADLIARGQVTPLTAANTFSAAFDVSDTFSTDLLLKNPMLIDKLPAYVSDLVSYLIEWMRRYIKA